MTAIQRVYFPEVELRVAGDPGDPAARVKICGRAGVCNSPTKIRERVNGKMVEFVEEFKPGAFRAAVASRADVVALINHDDNLVLGRVAAGTLSLREAENGDLECEIDPDEEISYARNAVRSVKRGDYRGMSIGFLPKPGGVRWSSDRTHRSIFDCDLFDVSVVTRPAYQATNVGIRSASIAEEFEEADREAEAEAERIAAIHRRMRAAEIRLRSLDDLIRESR